MNKFFDQERLPKTRGATSIVLIPKIDGAASLKDFRPVSLLGILYKIMGKVLASKLKKKPFVQFSLPPV